MQEKDKDMERATIGGIARRAGVGVETVRYYERRGLIERPPKPAKSAFRRYPEDTARRIRFIREAQRLGFSLGEIDELLSLKADPDRECKEVREKARAKRAEVDRRIARLRDISGALDALIAACPGDGATRHCSILETLARAEDTIEAAGGGERGRVGKTRTGAVGLLAAMVLAVFLWAGAAFADGVVYRLRVDGLTCPFCAYGIVKTLSAIDGVL